MYTKWQSVSYAVQINLMNDFLESFLLVFGENKYTNLKRYWTNFCYKTANNKKSKSCNGYKALIKYTFSVHKKHLNIKIV